MNDEASQSSHADAVMRLAAAQAKPADLMLNGLTQAETEASASCAGLTREKTMRADFERFVCDFTGRSMDYHIAAGTWGLGSGSLAWACWRHAARTSTNNRSIVPDCGHVQCNGWTCDHSQGGES